MLALGLCCPWILSLSRWWREVKLVEVGVKQGEVLVCSAVHTIVEWMVITTARVRLLKVEGFASGWPQLCRVAVPDEDVAHHKALYSVGEEMRLLVCPRDGGINVYSVSGEGVSLLHSTTSSELILIGRIAKLSLAGTVCVCAGRLCKCCGVFGS